jgi:hypothetical protein
LVVTPSDGLPVGDYRCEVAVKPETESGQLLPTKSIRVFARVIPDIKATPECVVFGARRVGEVSDETIALSSVTGQSFEVIDTRAEGDGLSVERAFTRGIETPIFRVRQRLGQGANSGLVRIKTRSKDGQEFDVEVPTKGYGIVASPPS